MLDFSNIKVDDMKELKDIIIKNVEKSEMERIFLFSLDVKDKAKIFMWCFRFLVNVYNLIEDGDLKKELEKEIILTQPFYKKISYYSTRAEEVNFGSNDYLDNLFILINKDEVNDLIDVFSVLTEKVNVLKMSRFKGIILEGKSGQEYKKIFKEV